MRCFGVRSVPRQLMVRRKTLLLAAALVAALAASVAGCSGSLRSVTPPDRLAVNRAAAWTAARAAIGHVPLPAGAVLVGHEPAGDHGLLAIGSETDPEIAHDPDTAHVSLTAWWIVPSSAAHVLRYVGNHPTPGSFQNGNGATQLSAPRAASHFVNAYWPSPGRGIASRRLQVSVTRLAHGQTGVMATVDVEWVVPRPANEVVPAGVRSVTLTLVRPRQGGGVGSTTEVTLHNPRMIRRATRLVDSLTAEQPVRLPCAEWPSTYRCPADPSGPGSLSISFRTRPAGAALAQARVGIPVGWGYTGVVGDPIRFWVHGHPAHALSGAAFVRHTLALAGLHAG